MTEPLPTNIGFGTVRGRWGTPLLADGDDDGEPNFDPMVGLVVTFTPSVKFILNATASPAPVTMAMVPLVCQVDEEGYLVSPKDNVTRGVKLIATNDPDLNPHGDGADIPDWTWHVTYGGAAGWASLSAGSITVPEGSDRYMTLIGPVPSSQGVSLSQAEAAQAIAITAASAAAASAAAAAASAASIDPAAGRLGMATNPEQLIFGGIGRDANGAAIAADLLWPDGMTGLYTGVPSTTFLGAVDSYVVTYGAPTALFTYTQPTMTRNGAGAVVTRPEIVVT